MGTCSFLGVLLYLFQWCAVPQTCCSGKFMARPFIKPRSGVSTFLLRPLLRLNIESSRRRLPLTICPVTGWIKPACKMPAISNPSEPCMEPIPVILWGADWTVWLIWLIGPLSPPAVSSVGLERSIAASCQPLSRRALARWDTPTWIFSPRWLGLARTSASNSNPRLGRLSSERNAGATNRSCWDKSCKSMGLCVCVCGAFQDLIHFHDFSGLKNHTSEMSWHFQVFHLISRYFQNLLWI